MPCEEEQVNKKHRRINKRCCIQTLVPWSFFVASLEGGGERAEVCAAVSVDVLLRPLIKNNKTVAEGEEDGLVAFAVGIRSQTSFVCVSLSAFFFQPASGRRPQRRYATENTGLCTGEGRQQQEKDKQLLLLLRNKIGEGSEARDNRQGEREGRSERETRRRELKREYYTDTDKARAAATIPFPCTALNR
jgi:hypothetical protein